MTSRAVPKGPLNATEREAAASVLARASDLLSRRICNDFVLPNTDEAWALIVAYHDWNGDPQDCPKRPKGDVIWASDHAIAAFLARRLRESTS